MVSMEGQLQTWISLQIKESLWGPNPVRHSLGRLYKGSTLNPRRVRLNEITPGDVWHIVILHILLCIPPSRAKSDGQRTDKSVHLKSNWIWLVSPLFLSFSSPFLCSCQLSFFSSRWEAFRVLPPAESLTNVALKCNEVWNGSCGYNYPRTGPVTGMISLSLAIRIGCEKGSAWGRVMERFSDRQWSHRVMSVEAANKCCIHGGIVAYFVHILGCRSLNERTFYLQSRFPTIWDHFKHG